MKIFKILISAALFILIVVLGVKIVKASLDNQKYKHDYAEINHFKYGLFSVDAWKEQMSDIISKEIDDLYLTQENRKTIRKQLEKTLDVFIDKVYARILKSNEDDFFKKGLINSFVDIKEVKKGIPEYAQTIMKEMSTSKSEKQIKKMLKERINTYMKETFDTREKSIKDTIVDKTGAQNEVEANQKLRNIIQDNHKMISKYSIIIICVSALLFLWEFFVKTPLHVFHYVILSLTLVILLFIGVTTPMIDMEAKISTFSFMLMNNRVEFENQILYFQSKSIMDVFRVMIHHKEIQMKVVGILVVSFSVIFPVVKMLSTIAYYYNYCDARKKKLIQFFVLKLGKWSMADVLVVAIFMAYIGFNGIINSQLSNMGKAANEIDLITTNGTSLQPGFYIFLTYVILAMFLSILLEKRPHPCE